jgi:hypothetical protein
MKTPTSSAIGFIVVLGLLGSICSLNAAEPPANAPAAAGAPATASAASTQPEPPRKIMIPQGFKLVPINGRNFLIEPADEAWATATLAKVQPTTKPATLPATLLQKLTSQRTALLQELARDLALRDLTAAARTYDLELVAPIRALDTYRPPVFFLVTTPDRIAALLRSGWNDPHFYYNRAADAVSFNPAGILNMNRPQDQVLFPATYDPKDTPEKRAEQVINTINVADTAIQNGIEQQARTVVGTQLAGIIHTQGVEPLGLKEDQQWFGLGIASVLTAKYASMITGDARAELMKMLTAEYPANPIPTSAVDLLHPVSVKDMRQDMLPAYFDAVRRKSTRVVQAMVDKGGDAAIAKSVAAIRDKKPADGAAVLKIAQDASGVDLAPMLGKGS